MPRQVLRVAVALLIVLLYAIQPGSSTPQSRGDTATRDQSVRMRTDEYQHRLNFMFAAQVHSWSESFLTHRRQAILLAGQTLASKAIAIRTAKGSDWSQIRNDPEFKKSVDESINSLLEPQEMRSELTLWAQGVEGQTRQEMVDYFRQIIAEDLGRSFDLRLRGKVIKAVQAIPLTQLIAADRTRIEDAIAAGLPKTLITSGQRTAIARAAGALAYVASPVVAATVGIPTLSASIQTLASLLVQWMVSAGLEALDRTLAGEPSAKAISYNLEVTLRDWNNRTLVKALTGVLQQFGADVMNSLEREAQRINLQPLGNSL